MANNLPELQGIQFTFTRRPEPVPGEFRPRWKVAVILLSLLHCGRGKSRKMSIPKLKILSWANRNTESQQALIRFIENNQQPEDVLIRHEPALIRALNIAAGMNLIERDGETISITDTGLSLASSISENRDILVDVKSFLSIISKRLTEEKTKEITEIQ